MPIARNEGPTLIFHSGLGNQLFQWASFVIAAKKGVKIKPGFVRSLLTESRKLQVESLLKSQGFEMTEFNDFEFKVGRKLAESDLLPKILKSKYLDLTSNPFELLDYLKIGASRSILGYFQNVKHLEENIDVIYPLLENYLGGIELPENFCGELFNIVHIRRGDLNSESNKAKYGILSANYYSNLDLDSSYASYIVTDDVAYAEEISKNMKIEKILGPDKLDEWQTFKLMAGAKNLYSANSTLSLWAGILVTQNGNSLYVPKPFFRDTNFDSSNSLSPSRANRLNSDFTN